MNQHSNTQLGPFTDATAKAGEERGATGTTGSARIEDFGSSDFLSLFHSNMDFKDFAPISEQFVESYGRLAKLGLPASAVAVAMMQATINFYNVFGMGDQLPKMLRLMAEMLEFRGEPS
ncbi:MAG: hypothetical protein RLZZ08_133 [Pseudomonadota bacterium]|jgi:hypothetical protein